MKLLYFVSFVTFQTRVVDMDIDVEGEVAIDLKIPTHLNQFRVLSDERSFVTKANETIETSPSVFTTSVEIQVTTKRKHYRNKMTVGPMVECMYQFPEDSQVQAILSNMMNVLTKVFVRAQDMMSGEFRRRRGETRFRVVDKKNTDFFEDIYGNMTKEYLTFVNTTSVRVDRSGLNRDPCQHQDEIKQIWKDLLDDSLTTFRRAAFQCIEENLKVQNLSTDVKARGRLGQFLIRELSKVRRSQLDLLCDNFQLCYSELL